MLSDIRYCSSQSLVSRVTAVTVRFEGGLSAAYVTVLVFFIFYVKLLLDRTFFETTLMRQKHMLRVHFHLGHSDSI